MKSKVVFLVFLFLTIFFLFDLSRYAITKSAGAPEGETGSPGDGESCAKSTCHGGTATFQAGMVTSTVGSGGYNSDSTYTISATVSKNGIHKFGFEASPQNTAGTQLGTLIVTNATDTKLVGYGKYITHTLAGNNGTDTRTWTFHWTPPPAGSGTVTMYAAFNAANGDSLKTGDKIFTSSLVIPESLVNGIYSEKLSVEDLPFRVYPNPAFSFTRIVSRANERIDNITVYDSRGREVTSRVKFEKESAWVWSADILFLPAGLYFVRVQSGGRVFSAKLIRTE